MTAERVEDGARWGGIEVSDARPGIAPADQAAVFDPYYRSASMVGVPGVGLGLAISRALLHQMSGDLSVQSEVGSGARFTIRLPLAP